MSNPTYELVGGAMEAVHGIFAGQETSRRESIKNAAIISRCVSHELALEMDARRELAKLARWFVVLADSSPDDDDIAQVQEQFEALLAKHQEND